MLTSILLGAILYFTVPEANIDTQFPPSLFLALFAALGLVLAAPLAHAFLAAAYLAIMFGSSLPEPAIVSTTVTGMSKFLLLAIPFFLLVGGLLTASGVANQLVRFAASMVGHRRAGTGANNAADQRSVFRVRPALPSQMPLSVPPLFSRNLSSMVIRPRRPVPLSLRLLCWIMSSALDCLPDPGRRHQSFRWFASGRRLFRRRIDGRVPGGGNPSDGSRAAQPAPCLRGGALESFHLSHSAFGLGVIVVIGIRIGIVTTTVAAALAAIYTFGLAIWSRLGFSAIFSHFGKQRRRQRQSVF